MNVEPTSTLPHKQPKQQRSKTTVQQILKAAAETLAKDGLENFNTNLLAERSGVSVGTIYQYFSSKDQIIRALIDRHIEDRTQKIRTIMNEAPANETRRQSMIRCFRRVAEWLQLDPEYSLLNRALFMQLPRSYAAERFNELDQRLAEILKAQVLRTGGFPADRNLDVAIRVGLKAARGTFQVLESTPIGTQELDDAIIEIAGLMERFFFQSETKEKP
ncbi:MAG: TetR/AcrR family transcriptional regulator [Bdellovibrionales bacterium]|nr:TetR/AcrR family transcriptional regulator [Bdellovibrionales bacterium]